MAKKIRKTVHMKRTPTIAVLIHRNIRLAYFKTTRTWFSAPFTDMRGDTCIVDGPHLGPLKKLIDKVIGHKDG